MTVALITTATTAIVTIIGSLTGMIVTIRSHGATTQAMTTALKNSVPMELVQQSNPSHPSTAPFTKLSGQPYNPEA